MGKLKIENVLGKNAISLIKKHCKNVLHDGELVDISLEFIEMESNYVENFEVIGEDSEFEFFLEVNEMSLNKIQEPSKIITTDFFEKLKKEGYRFYILSQKDSKTNLIVPAFDALNRFGEDSVDETWFCMQYAQAYKVNLEKVEI